MASDQPKIIFFGMDSQYSTVVLQALTRGGMAPCLVVDGVEHPKHRRSPILEFYPVRHSFGSKLRRLLRIEKAYEPNNDGAKSCNLVHCAHELGIDALVASRINGVRARAKLHAIKPDFFVVASFPTLLSKHVLNLAAREGLNLHPGRLPEERGPAPLFWALKAGRTEIHYSIHVLAEGEDTGDILGTGTFAFASGTGGRDILTMCAQQASSQVLRIVRSIWAGDVLRTPQSKNNVGRCPRPSFRDGLIDKSKSATEVFTFVSACADVYPIFTECGGDRFFIATANSYDDDETLPCEFMLSGDNLLLRCNPGVVELTLKPYGGALFSSEYHETEEEQ